MNAENWSTVKSILDEVLEIEAERRPSFLDSRGLTPEIRSEVESLISFETEAEGLMKFSAVEFSKDFIDDDASMAGQEIGPYRIISELGHGGMGAVYLAERADGKFSQRVALKLLKRELNTSSLRRRFQQEQEILASLEHPNIARLLDAGATEDKIPFLAMEYVEGLPIDDYCDLNGASLRQRLDLFRKVCSAVNFAHRNLIVHRDLKPSNILVTEDGTPKLLDFGISKILSAEVENTATVTKLGVMTPSYASPEQLRNESVTTASDVYSLGVILYELLSGHRPFESKESNLKDIYQAVIDIDPPLPSEIWKDTITRQKADTANSVKTTGSGNLQLTASSMRGDLDNIILKALKKEPERRYSTPENFADDIKRHLDGLPVTARPDTFAYRAEKFIKRNSFSVIAASLILIAVVAGVLATLWQARVARAERANAEKRFNDVRTLANSFLFEFSPMVQNLPGSTPARKLLVTRALEYLDNLSQEAGDHPTLQQDLAAAYEQVGDVQGNPYTPNIGDVKGALASYEKALGIRDKLRKSNVIASELQSGDASLFEKIGGLHANGGDYDKGVLYYEKALVLREAEVAADPSNYDARAKLARALRSRGLIPFFEGDNKKALEYYIRARDIYEKLHAERPTDDKVFQDYAYIFTAIGEAYGWDDEVELAAENTQEGLELLVPLGEKYPTDQSVQRSLLLAYNKRGENYEDTEKPDKAVESYSKSVAISLAAYKADPQSFQARRDLAMGYKKMAQALDSAGRSKESLDTMNLALASFQEMSAADPNNNEALYDVANTRFSVGETYFTMKDYDNALKTFQTAQSEFVTVLSRNPDSPYAIRMSTYNLDRMGKTYLALAEKGDRQTMLEKALENFRTAMDGFNRMKANGKLGDHDLKALPEMEARNRDLEAKVATK